MRLCIKCKTVVHGMGVDVFICTPHTQRPTGDLMCRECGANGQNSLTRREYDEMTR